MQLSFALVLAVTATLVSSQSVSSLVAQLPSCAISCLASASSTVGCGISDYACQCGTKKAALVSAATPCVLKACSSTDALKTNGITGDICKAATSGTQTSLTNQGSYVSNIYPATSSTATYTTVATASLTTYPAGGAGATSTATSAASYVASATSSTPATVSGNAGSRLHGGVVAAGAVMLAALAL